MPLKLVIDLGNSKIKFALFSDSRIKYRQSFETRQKAFKTYYSDIVSQFLNNNKIKTESISQVVIASVVPGLDNYLKQSVEKFIKAKITEVSYEECGKLKINLSNKNSIGADRLANAVALRDFYSGNSLAIDIGTATTFEFVSETGRFEGGIIAAGPLTSFNALINKSSKLSDLKLSWPKSVLGKNTKEAISAGILLGHLSLIEGLIEKLENKYGKINKIVVTGGMGKMFSKALKYNNIYDQHLTLKGICRIGELKDG